LSSPPSRYHIDEFAKIKKTAEEWEDFARKQDSYIQYLLAELYEAQNLLLQQASVQARIQSYAQSHDLSKKK
jgi:hypothetical protein